MAWFDRHKNKDVHGSPAEVPPEAAPEVPPESPPQPKSPESEDKILKKKYDPVNRYVREVIGLDPDQFRFQYKTVEKVEPDPENPGKVRGFFRDFTNCHDLLAFRQDLSEEQKRTFDSCRWGENGWSGVALFATGFWEKVDNPQHEWNRHADALRQIRRMIEGGELEDEYVKAKEKGVEAYDKERREEKERVMTALHLYYQEQAVNTPLQRELARLIEEAKEITLKAMPYFEVYLKGAYPETERIEPRFDYEPGYPTEIRLMALDKNSKEVNRIDESEFDIILGNSFLGKKLAGDEKFAEAKKEIKRASSALAELKVRVENQRKEIFLELLTVLGLGSLAAEGRLNLHRMGLYGLEGKADISFSEEKEITIKGSSRESKFIDGNWVLPDLIQDAKFRYFIPDEEIEKIMKIEWTPEEKKRLEALARVVGQYRKQLPQIKPRKGGDYEYSLPGHELVLREDTAAFARVLYDEKLKLPPQHREKVVQQLKSVGSIEF